MIYKEDLSNMYNKKDIPIIYPFVVDGLFYIYDTYTNHILKINQKQYKEICELHKIGVCEYRIKDKNTKEYNDIISLLNKGYFHVEWIDEIKHRDSDNIVYLLNRSINRLTLQVTHDCNMCCRYCNFSKDNKIDRTHGKRNMPLSIAKQSIDFLYAHSKDIGKVYISFYGGEPFLNFDLIQNATNYSKQLFELKEIQYNITTNATIMTEDIISYLVNNNVFLSISLDGPKEIQNKHRLFSENGMDTFDIVMKNIEKLKKYENYFRRYVNFLPVYFSDEKKDDVLEFYERIGINRSCVIMREADLRGIDYDEIQNRNKNQTENEKKYTYFCDALDDKNPIPSIWQHNGPCIPGVQKIFVNIDGDIQLCEKIIDYKKTHIGNVYNGFDFNKVKFILNLGKINEVECKKCWCMRFCKICAAQCIDTDKGEIDKNSLKICCHNTKQSALLHLQKYVRSHQGLKV